MNSEDIRILLAVAVTTFCVGWLFSLFVFYSYKSQVIEDYQNCLSAGATVEYCKSNLK